MRMRSAHKLITNSNGNAASSASALLALVGFIALIGFLLAPFL